MPPQKVIAVYRTLHIVGSILHPIEALKTKYRAIVQNRNASRLKEKIDKSDSVPAPFSLPHRWMQIPVEPNFFDGKNCILKHKEMPLSTFTNLPLSVQSVAYEYWDGTIKLAGFDDDTNDWMVKAWIPIDLDLMEYDF